MNQVDLIIPIFNEEENLLLLFEEINEVGVYKRMNKIIFVDDGSTDNSLIILKNIKKKYNKVNYICHKKNLGQSTALNSGIIFSKSDIIITIDGDGQNNPSDITKLLDFFLNNRSFSLVSGIRKKRHDDYIKVFSSLIANSVRRFILQDKCSDTGCSLKVFERKIFLSFPFFDGIHRFLPALFLGFKYKTYFIEVSHRSRIKGYSKYGTLDRLFKGLFDLFRVLLIIKGKKFND